MAGFDFLKPAPYVNEIADGDLVKKQYRYWRLRVLYGMYVGYAFYYFTRKSFTIIMPAMVKDLGFDKADLGIIASILSITYGMSKFLSGILADRANPRYFMGIGLILTGVCNILFGFSSSLFFFAFFWGLNGLFQGWGWPPIARLLTHWYSQSERGRWWGIWNTSHNVGGAIIPFIAAFCAELYGWRTAMFVPGILCILIGFFIINRLRDTPQSLGLPAIEKFRDDYPDAAVKDDQEEKKLTTKEILLEYVFKNKFIWFLAFANFFVYVVRNAINDWGTSFLVETKGYSLVVAGGCVFWFEMGGFLGSLAAGWMSDILFKGRRGPANVIFALGVVLSVGALWLNNTSNYLLDSLLFCAIGFFIFGPQMLIGMSAVELTHKKAAASANGFGGWFGYLGAACAGFPLGIVARDYGWYGFFVVLLFCGLISIAFLLPTWGAKSRVKKEVKNKKPVAETES